MKKLIRKGKIKEVYEVSDTKLNFFFPDNVAVFDKIILNDIPRKGETLCKTSAYWFERVEEELGLRTHFIEMVEDHTISVKKIDRISDHKNIDKRTTNFVIPLEFISRYYVAGSLYERIEKGDVDYKILGFDEKPDYGDPLPDPFLEVSTKLEDYDKVLTEEEALKLSRLSEKEFQQVKKAVLSIDELIKNNIEKNGLLHVDSKKEFGMDEDRNLILVDTFGTADEDRFWEKDEYEKGNFIQKNREFVKQYYKDIGYLENIMRARENNEEEPSIPNLPEDIVQKTSELYVDMMKRLTDRKYT